LSSVVVVVVVVVVGSIFVFVGVFGQPRGGVVRVFACGLVGFRKTKKIK
jgi:hypothetical protein